MTATTATQMHVDVAQGVIAGAYYEISAGSQYVKLAKIWAAVQNEMDKATFAAALTELISCSDVIIIPESNRKTLTAEDHAASVVIGDQDKHLIWMN